MHTYRDQGAPTFKRPCCFQHRISEPSTYTETQDLSVILRTSSDYFRTDPEMLTNSISPEDEFARRSLAVLFDNSVANKEADKIRIRKLLRQVSLDVLATEWLNLEPRTIENRAYLIDSVLPQVIFGLEHVLREAMKKQLVGPNVKESAIASGGSDPNFNPINRLAEFLMRNNHRYSNFCETSPYVRGLRNTVAKLQNEMFMRCDSQLAKLKAAVTRTREEKAKKQIENEGEHKRREACVAQLFEAFLSPGQETVEASAIQSAICAFIQLSVKLPESVRQMLIPIFEKNIVEERPKAYERAEFMLYVMIYAEPLSTDIFNMFMEHLKTCAQEYRNTVENETKKHLLTNFYISCDVDQVDAISRTRVLNMCDTYFDSAPKDVRVMLRNPRDWPVREYHLRVTSKLAKNAVVEERADLLEVTKNVENGFALDQNNSAVPNTCEVQLTIQPQDHTEMKPPNDDTELQRRESKAWDSDMPVNDFVESTVEKEAEESTENDEPRTGNASVSGQEEYPINATEDHVIETKNNRETSCSSIPLDEQTLLCALSARSKTLVRSASTNSSRQLRYGYDSDRLTLLQFLQIMSQFIKDDATVSVVEQIIQYFEREYQNETTSEQRTRSCLMPQPEYKQRLDSMINQLFNLLNTESSGLIDWKKFEKLLQQFRDGAYVTAIQKADSDLATRIQSTRQPSSMRIRQSHKDGEKDSPKLTESCSSVEEHKKLGYAEFSNLLRSAFDTDENELLSDDMEQKLTDLNDLIEVVRQSPEPDLTKKLRVKTRHLWLNSIDNAAEQSTVSMQAVYKSVFEILLKDSLQFGHGKRISAHIFVLQSTTEPKQIVLSCVAAVPETEAQTIVGRLLYPNETSVSFQAVRSGKLIHLPQVTSENAEAVPFWDEERVMLKGTKSDQENDGFGSCVLIPIPTPMRKFIGLLVIDTIAAETVQPGFDTHELEFYQGVADRLGRAYSLISVRRVFAQTVLSGFNWLSYHLPHVDRMILYYCRDEKEHNDNCAPDEESPEEARHRACVLQVVVSKNRDEQAILHQAAQCIKRTNNDCMTYLFNVADTSEPCDKTLLGTRHLVYPLRDSEKVAFGVIDLLCQPSDAEHMPWQLEHEAECLNKLLGILDMTYQELVNKTGTETMDRLTLSGSDRMEMDHQLKTVDRSNVFNQVQSETVFDQLMLAELYELRCTLTDEIFTELSSYIEPPSAVIKIVQAFLILTSPETMQGQCRGKWNNYRHVMSIGLQDLISLFDPNKVVAATTLEALDPLLVDLTQDEVDQCQSRPAQILYRWIRCARTVFHNLTKSETE